MKKSKGGSGKGSGNIRTKDCKKEKYIDNTLTSATQPSLLVPHLKKDLEKQEKGARIKKMAVSAISRLRITGHIQKMCLMIELTEKITTIHFFSCQRTNDHAVKLSARQFKRKVFLLLHLLATRYCRHSFGYSRA